VVDILAGGDVLKWEAVTKLENSVIQIKLMRDGIIARAEYNHREKHKK